MPRSPATELAGYFRAVPGGTLRRDISLPRHLRAELRTSSELGLLEYWFESTPRSRILRVDRGEIDVDIVGGVVRSYGVNSLVKFVVARRSGVDIFRDQAIVIGNAKGI